MELAVFVILLLLALAFVGYPLVTRSQWSFAEAPSIDPQLETLLSQRNAVYASIKELDFDRESGNLSDEDYEDLKQRYSRKAVGILKTIHELEQDRASSGADGEEPDLDQWVETEVRALRTKAAPRVDPEVESDQIVNFCPRCGGRVQPRDNFCIRCGEQLRLA